MHESLPICTREGFVFLAAVRVHVNTEHKLTTVFYVIRS